MTTGGREEGRPERGGDATIDLSASARGGAAEALVEEVEEKEVIAEEEEGTRFVEVEGGEVCGGREEPVDEGGPAFVESVRWEPRDGSTAGLATT